MESPLHKGIAPVTQCVPQGSVLTPLLFIISILPVGQMNCSHGLSFQCYTDDIQLYEICYTSYKMNFINIMNEYNFFLKNQ